MHFKNKYWNEIKMKTTTSISMISHPFFYIIITDEAPYYHKLNHDASFDIFQIPDNKNQIYRLFYNYSYVVDFSCSTII